MGKRSIRRRRKLRSKWRVVRSPLMVGVIAAVLLASSSLLYAGYTGMRGGQLAATGNVTQNAPTSCDIAKQRAVSRQANHDGAAIGGITGISAGSNVLDKCFSAIINKRGEEKKRRGIQLTAEDYDCHGRKAQTSVRTDQVTDISVPDLGSPPGKCNRTVTSETPGQPQPGDQQKPEEQKPEEKGGGGGAPQLPKPPEKKPKEEQQAQNCQQNPTAPGCPEARKPAYCIPVIAQYLPGCDTGQTPEEPPQTLAEPQDPFDYFGDAPAVSTDSTVAVPALPPEPVVDVGGLAEEATVVASSPSTPEVTVTPIGEPAAPPGSAPTEHTFGGPAAPAPAATAGPSGALERARVALESFLSQLGSLFGF